MRTPRTPLAAGFTLIEILVVMAILSLLAAALLPPLLEVGLTAQKMSDRLALRWHHTQLERYKQQRGHYPQREGHKLVLATWIEGVVEHTKANRDRYLSAALADDPAVIAIRAQKVDALWKSFETVTSADTSFAGRGLRGRRHMGSGKETWMATDNEGGNVYPDGSVLLLRGDGTVEELPRVPDQLEFGASPDPDVEFCLAVGAGSPHPDLRKLRK